MMPVITNTGIARADLAHSGRHDMDFAHSNSWLRQVSELDC